MNLLKHKKLRALINQTRNGTLWPPEHYDFRDRASYLALLLTREGLVYGTGGRYQFLDDSEEPATWSRFVKQGEAPALECAGFIEMILYGLGVIDREIFTYRELREVPETTRFRAGQASINWIPGENRPPTITEENGMGAWAQTPVLLYFDNHFEPISMTEPICAGDVLSFMSRDDSGYHFHSAIWIEASEHGIVHSSPSSAWDRKDGAKFTPVDSKYFRDFLQPQQRTFAAMFGSAVTRRKEAV